MPGKQGIVYAVTGGTGSLGRNLVWEIIKENRDDLDNIRIVWFGRDKHGMALSERVKALIKCDGRHYFGNGHDESIIKRALACIIPIKLDLTQANLGLGAKDVALIKQLKFDYFFHLASLADLRYVIAARKALEKVNVEGFRRFLKMIASIDVAELIYVSSAFACGEAEGLIKPDFINTAEKFRNPYEQSKARAERLFLDFCRQNGTRYRIFRPAILAGRSIEAPLGHTAKFDTFYGWARFFLKLKKRTLLPGQDLFDAPAYLPFRVHFNPRYILSVVPVDFCAKLIYSCTRYNHPAHHMHVVSLKGVTNAELFQIIFDNLNIEGVSQIDRPPANMNLNEQVYYDHYEKIYAPYIAGRRLEFDCQTMLNACTAYGLPPVTMGAADFRQTLTFARERQYGLVAQFDAAAQPAVSRA